MRPKKKKRGSAASQTIAENTLPSESVSVFISVHLRFHFLRAAGLSTPILVPSSTAGGQLKAFEEVLAAFAD